MNETLTVVTNGFSDDTDNHGLQLVLISLDEAYATSLVKGIKAFDQICESLDLGRVAEVLVEDERAIYTEMDEEEGLDDDFTGAFGLLKRSVPVPSQSEQITHSFLVVLRDHVMWQGHTRESSIIHSQTIPLDFLEAVAAGERAEAARLASRRKRFDEEGRAVYYHDEAARDGEERSSERRGTRE